MRHFVYLDTDTLNSYLSQINGGLLKSTVNEVKDEVATTTHENTNPGKSNFTTEMGFKPILNFKFSEDKDVINTTNTLSQTETGKELIEKILHDNALEQFTLYLESNNLINTEICKVGDYVKFNAKFSIRDLDYLSQIYSNELVEFFIENSKIEAKHSIEQQEVLLKNNPNKNAIIKTLRKETDELIKAESNSYVQARKIINLSRTIMPFSKYIVSNNCVIPLTEEYLRSTTNNIRFTYSGEITVVGRYTSDLKDSFARESETRNGFDDVLKSIDEVFKVLYKDTLGLDECMKIIVPIALYFE
ncbi:UNVERIFIED_ORG: hypothetical protein B2H98_05195 [Clostridium botulinum]